MKIFTSNNNTIDKVVQAYKNQEVNKAKTNSNKTSRNDELSLSDLAKDYQVAMNAIKNLPDVREEKVRAIKEQISTGTYVIDAGKIAEKMIENVSFDKRV
ncbi:MAG: flagellar biosynthesis anti-sigma factor FlgM [Tissierellales bacterium]